MIGSSDRTYLISRKTVLIFQLTKMKLQSPFLKKFQSIGAANTFCCEKIMKLTSIKTQDEIKILANDLKSIALS
jgi:hypothetical protein